MKTFRNLIFSLAGVLGASVVNAAPVHIGNAYVGGEFGTFGIEYEQGAPGLQLTNIYIQLASSIYLDPTAAAPGEGSPLPLTALSGGMETGFSGATGIVDGSQGFLLSFTDFNPGEFFAFSFDVDGTCGAPSCSPAEYTTGEEFDGAFIYATFGGTGYETRTLGPVLLYETSDLVAEADIYGDIPGGMTPTPEPASMALMAAGLAAVAFRKKFTSR